MLAPFLRLAAISILLGSPALTQTPGAVLPLSRVGLHVEGNHFPRKDAAYFSAGPLGGCPGAGLPDGDYCFQITDPAATVLLTPDPILERTVRVTGGVLAEYLGRTRASAYVGPCGSLNVRLAPFENTPYPGGEYKLWLTRVEDFDPAGSQLFGFDPARSKSDNFRVAGGGPQSILRGRAHFDHDENGVLDRVADPLDVELGGWRVELLRDGALDGVTYTDQDGDYVFIRSRDGSTYTVRERAPGGFVNDGVAGATWLATTPQTGAVAMTTEYVAGPAFGNIRYEVALYVGRTPEFWAIGNANAEWGAASILRDYDPAWRAALTTRNGAPVNLRNPVSNDNPSASIFALDPPPQSFNAAYSQWRNYVRKTPHDHAGFLLSRQVAATILNNTAGFMQGSILVDRFGDGVLVSLDDMLTGVIGLLSEVGAGLTGPNDPYQDLRARMIACTNEFGSINNTADPASNQVVFTRSMGPGPLPTLY